MPLIVKDFTWDESETTVFITIPLKGVKANKADIFSSEEYLKVSFPPYIFECLLKHPVDDINSSAHVGNGSVQFKLKKKDGLEWGQLQSDDAGNKEVMREKREAAQEQVQKRLEEERKTKAEKKREEDRYAINQMMKLEEDERKRIEDIKESERLAATQSLERWKDEQKTQAEMEKKKLLEERKAKEEERRKQERKNGKRNIFENENGLPTRQNGKIEITHTPRVFPTPVRESQAPLEEEWLRKQAENRRLIEVEDADLTEEEKNPLFLRDKANGFFKAGDYHSAINAYTHAIRLSNQMPGLYSNRAACHLKLRNLIKCIEDCSKAMDLLHPPVPQNAASRCKALVRRGTAFCQLEMYVEGLQDYEAALKIDHNNTQLEADAERIRQIIQGSTD